MDLLFLLCVLQFLRIKLLINSHPRVSEVTLLTKESFIFKIGDPRKDDLNRILEDNKSI